MSAPRRKRMEGALNAGIYERPDGRLEVGWRDRFGRQRWESLPKGQGLQAARRLRDARRAERDRGERAPQAQQLRIGEATDAWLASCDGLRPKTQAAYRGDAAHLTKRFARLKLDDLTPDDLAALVVSMRDQGYAERSIAACLGAAHQVYRYATRRLGWRGQDPTRELLRSERPRSTTTRRALFTPDSLRETLLAAEGQWRVLFLTAATTGVRLSELLALRWEHANLQDLDDATIAVVDQVDRRGLLQPLKTEESARVLPISRALAETLAAHCAAQTAEGPWMFQTATGRPLSQRNVHRALRAAQKRARRPDGSPTFPPLHEIAAPTSRDGRRDRLTERIRGVPSTHSLRHGVASAWLAAGGTADEAAWLLGHKDATVTRKVYLHETNDAARRALQRDRLAAATDVEGLLGKRSGSARDSEGRSER